MAEYYMLIAYVDGEKIAKGEAFPAMLADEDMCYRACKIKVAQTKEELPGSDDLWIRSGLSWRKIYDEPWAVQILEEYDFDSEEGAEIQKLGGKTCTAGTAYGMEATEI